MPWKYTTVTPLERRRYCAGAGSNGSGVDTSLNLSLRPLPCLYNIHTIQYSQNVFQVSNESRHYTRKLSLDIYPPPRKSVGTPSASQVSTPSASQVRMEGISSSPPTSLSSSHHHPQLATAHPPQLFDVPSTSEEPQHQMWPVDNLAHTHSNFRPASVYLSNVLLLHHKS